MDTWCNGKSPGSTGSTCPLCHGTGFAHPLMSSGEPDISEVYPCHCSDRYEPAGADQAGDILNLYWSEERRQ